MNGTRWRNSTLYAVASILSFASEGRLVLGGPFRGQFSGSHLCGAARRRVLDAPTDVSEPKARNRP
jgi:hypothetical protein